MTECDNKRTYSNRSPTDHTLDAGINILVTGLPASSEKVGVLDKPIRGKKMDKDKHQQRHIELHKSLDELFADFISHGGGRTSSTILELINWSHTQTIYPDHANEEQS